MLASMVALWHVERIRMMSPLPRQATLETLIDGIDDAKAPEVPHFGTGVVRGSWDPPGRALRLRVRRAAYTNSWAHRLYIRVIDTGDGTAEVRGQVGVPLWARLFTAVWLAAVAAFEILVTALALTGPPRPPIAFYIGPPLMFLLMLGTAVGGARAGRNDGEFLVNWVGARLRSQP